MGGGSNAIGMFADFIDDGAVNQRGTGSWIALLQHHFFSAWIPDGQDETTVSLHVDGAGARSPHLIRELGPGVAVGPGQAVTTSARLWVGPKLVGLIRAEDVGHHRILRGEVAAILTWRREDGDEEYHHLLRRDEWEVVLPELVFAAGAEAVNVDQKGS